jgi:hypothetical protein
VDWASMCCRYNLPEHTPAFSGRRTQKVEVSLGPGIEIGL